MENVRQSGLDQLPAGDALDGLRQGRRQSVQLVFHQDALKGLGGEVGVNERSGGRGDLKRAWQKIYCNRQFP